MCGICGFYNIKENFPDNDIFWQNILKKMNRRQYYRGTLYEDIYLSYHCGIGEVKFQDNNATRIYSIKSTGKELFIVFDGSIYNYKELKEELTARFTDCIINSVDELILYGFLYYGVEYIKKLNGAFSFAVLESERLCGIIYERLYLCRDRLGMKPLYYIKLKDFIAFSSETDAFYHILDNNVSPEKIQEVAAGCYIVIDGLNTKVTTYWDYENIIPQADYIKCGEILSDIKSTYPAVFNAKITEEIVVQRPITFLHEINILEKLFKQTVSYESIYVFKLSIYDLFYDEEFDNHSIISYRASKILSGYEHLASKIGTNIVFPLCDYRLFSVDKKWIFENNLILKNDIIVCDNTAKKVVYE